jgi:hypothetical protein
MLEYVMLLLATPSLVDRPPPPLQHQFFLTEEGCEQAVLRANLPLGYRVVCLPITVSAADDAGTLVAHY